MARLKDFVGSILIGSGMKPKGNYPLMEAHDILVGYDEENKEIRLDEKLENIPASSVEVTSDFTESGAGKAADAKAVGDILGDIHSVLERI